MLAITKRPFCVRRHPRRIRRIAAWNSIIMRLIEPEPREEPIWTLKAICPSSDASLLDG